MELIKYRPVFITYNSPQQIPTECNSITLINLGTSVAYVESVPLQPNQSLTIDGNECEFTDVYLQINFSPYDPDLNNNLVVVKKIYS